MLLILCSLIVITFHFLQNCRRKMMNQLCHFIFWSIKLKSTTEHPHSTCVQNGPCWTPSATIGICLTAAQCAETDGLADGNCAAGELAREIGVQCELNADQRLVSRGSYLVLMFELMSPYDIQMTPILQKVFSCNNVPLIFWKTTHIVHLVRNTWSKETTTDLFWGQSRKLS